MALLAQSELATLTGTVTDASGAVIRDVQITVTNKGTGAVSTVTTGESGRYFVANLRPGAYNVSAATKGFKKFVNEGITLQVAQAARLDITLQVGDTAEILTVTAEAPLLEAENAARGAVIEQRKIVELPLNGRDYNQLAILSPGVLPSTPRLQSIGFKGAFNVNGNRAFHNAFLLDGVDNLSYSNSFRGNNMQVVQPSVDALQEFRIQTNAYSAEYGRSAGALVNAVIKSGTNQLHGTAYHFFRNRELDASNFFANKSGAQKPFRLRNQFGATAGGPIVKNKLFVFGDYEGLRDRAGTVRFTSVPQVPWTQGRFTIPISNPFNPNDNGTDFRIPATPDCNNGQGFCWQIPSNLIDPVGRRVIAVAPAPNTGAPGQIDNNFVNVPVDKQRTDQFDIRVDNNITEKINWFARYSFSDTTLFRPAPRPGLAEGSFNDTFGTADWRSQAVAFGNTWVVRPTVVNDFRFGFAMGDFFQLPPNFGSGCPEALIGLKNSVTDESICGGLPVFNFPGGIQRRLGRTTSVPQFQTPRSYDFRDSVSLNRGNHAFKAGFEYLRVGTGIRDVGSLLGNFDFSGRFTNQNGQWQGAIADLLLGFPTRYQQDSNTVFNMFQRMYFGYLQDDWKIRRNLTLNLGVRYEFATPPIEEDLQAANFDFRTNSFVTAKNGSLFERTLIRPDRNNWAPRIGLAWSVSPKTVVRAGYGMFYNHTNRQGREGLLGFNPPFIILADANLTGAGRLLATNAFMKLETGVPPGFVDINRVNLQTVARRAQDSGQRTTYVQQWNLSIQREVLRDAVFEVGYIGNKGTKLAAFRNLNPATFTFNAQGAPVTGPRVFAANGLLGDIQFLENLGVSNYHSLQLRFEKRFSAGWLMLSSYTWGKALTNSVDHLSTSGAGNGVDVGVFREPQNPFSRRDMYGLAEFDVQHRWVTSAVWQLPFGKGRRFGSGMSRAADWIAGGWEFSPIFTWQSGLGLTINQAQVLNLGGERRSRPNRIASGSLPEGQRNVDRWFDTNAFVALSATPGTVGFVPNQAFGNSGVGILRGPGLVNLDFNLNKSFRVTETNSLQLRAEFFNAFNHANFGVPGVTAGTGFGQIVNTATEARIIQFALKYRF
jgi:hypothetical protein